MTLLPWILLAIICIEHLIFIPALIKRSGVGTAWHGYVPVLNALAILRIIERPWYWVLFLLVPGINLLMLIIMHVELAIVFGQRSTKDQWLMGLLPWISIPQLALGEDKYVGPRSWSKTRKSTFREWGEALLWATIVASTFRIFSFEPFTIPTGSMEGSMLVGDYLFVNKLSYGPKLPQTPFSLPFIHNALPGSMTPSFTSWFSLPYTRLPGIRDVERYDAVVFSFPPGDTIFSDKELAGHDYYGLLRREGIRNADGNIEKFALNPEKYLSIARDRAFIKPGLAARPIDKKENYVKRCIGLPGDSLSVIDRQVFINSVAIENPEHLQYEYQVHFTSPLMAKRAMKLLGLTNVDIGASQKMNNGIATLISLTKSEVETLNNSGTALSVDLMSTNNRKGRMEMFPNTYREEFNEWTPDDLGPIYIPKAGRTIELNERNLDMYRRVITAFEGHDLEVNAGGKVLIDGVESTQYTFQQDYYWMMGDNRHRSADSRMWGFVPEDHVIGRASFTWFSKQNVAQHGESKIRWSRMFKSVK
ncbi:MAG TPA: S26 family signal peptidase [Flavobacteriales bacterium]|jgi:signal peptidase I|nr:S26 family signal peptidase [Flavobacteriales bacterium]HIO16298.1 S26 family signal peptidase [Flavobacteriales bacterium]